MKNIVLGNEAIAQGAIDAGISGVYAYPGTPSTEITEYIQKSESAKELGIYSNWSANEKTAMESALGMSYAGKRALCVMKHVGLNVAMDVFMNMAVSGVNGGLVVVVADDPSMHSSQNEQDSRVLAKFAQIPFLEPSNQQEAYDIVRYAFDLSEKLELPVLVRMVTRLSHSRSSIAFKHRKRQKNIEFPVDTQRFALVPLYSKPQYHKLLALQDKITHLSEASEFTKLTKRREGKLGIVACGIAYNYLMENFEDGCPHSVLKLCQYPIPKEEVQWLMDNCEQVLVLEDGYPFIEEQINDFFRREERVIGRFTGHLPRSGELNPNLVAKSLGIKEIINEEISGMVKGRPPQLCDGCGHIDMYKEINELRAEVKSTKVFGDIGCYALGCLSPFNSIDTLIDMGASITMAKGAADAGVHPSIAVIGDSTFTHSGMTGLLDCIWSKSSVTIIIADNSTVAMTGAQDSSAMGKLKDICLGLGVEKEHLRIITPLKKHFDENVKVLREETEYQGVSVIITQRPCVRLPGEKKKYAKMINEQMA